MDKLRSAIFLSLRGYHKRPSRSPRYRKAALSEEKLYPEAKDYDEPDEDDFDDVEKDETEFMSMSQTYNEYKREEYIEKAKLKTRIIARKYFKSEDPNFITWTEKLNIQSLHEKDPVEFSADRLSESFPALPDTIRRILRAKWLPKAESTILNYDQKVIDNWKKFTSGQLAVSPRLESHLKKFEGRKIVAADLETISKNFIKKKPVFQDPQATLFTSIVTNYVGSPDTPTPLPKITDGKPKKKIGFSRVNIGKEPVNFDTFMESTVQKIPDAKNLSLELSLLVDQYKHKRDGKTTGDFENTSSGVGAKNVEKNEEVEKQNCKKGQGKSLVDEEMEKKILTRKDWRSELDRKIEEKGVEVRKGKKDIFVDIPKFEVDNESLATGIIEWKKKAVSGVEDYPRFIKIPKDKAQKNITFRVEDRYYDCDGEFLYRLPGLKSV